MRLIYRVAQTISYTYFRLFHGFRVQGLENIPKDKPFILACNHLSFFDPPAIGCKIPRNLHYFARDSLFFWPLGLLISSLNSIPVNRGQLDLGTLRKVLKVLKNGHPILVFPEGTRSEDGELQDPQKGLGLLVAKSSVVVIPARIYGSGKAFGKKHLIPRIGRKIYINIGVEISFDDPKDVKSKKNYLDISTTVMSAIEKL
jgi:1-acyl-sn-glycerol-3-phosphate acyltransferase